MIHSFHTIPLTLTILCGSMVSGDDVGRADTKFEYRSLRSPGFAALSGIISSPGDAGGGCMMGRKRKKPKIVDGVELWQCSKCKERKPREEMSKQASNPSGLHSQCKRCLRIAARRPFTPEPPLVDANGITEEWRSIEGFPYEVSSFGRVRRSEPGNRTRVGSIVSHRRENQGTLWINIRNKQCKGTSFAVRCLVVSAYIGEVPYGHKIVHKNGDNADCNINNLEIVGPEQCDTPPSMAGFEEEWRPWRTGVYEVSSFGRFRRDGIVLAQFINRDYLKSNTSINGKSWPVSIHRVVAESYLGVCPDGLEVNHIDAVKENNTPVNLEYVTRKGNAEHAVAMGLCVRGEDHCASKLTNEAVIDIRESVKAGVMQKDLAQKYDVSCSTIGDVVKGKTWTHV